MPILFAPLVGIILGAVFAWVAAPELSRNDGPLVASRPFAMVVAFATLVWLPVVGYFAAFHGDWSYLYLVPWRRVPSAVDLVLVLFATAVVVVAFSVTAAPVRRRRFGLMLVLIVAPATIALAGLPLAARRLAVSATYAQFQGDFGTESIGASLLGKGVLLMGLVLMMAVAWTVRCLMRMERRDGASDKGSSST